MLIAESISYIHIFIKSKLCNFFRNPLLKFHTPNFSKILTNKYI